LPDLRGCVAVGADGTHPLGSTFGQAETTLSQANLPQPTGSDTPVQNDQPSLALNYIIATNGAFSTQDAGGFTSSEPTIGQVSLFAGNFAPSGWALCQGQVLPITTNTALFSILGTQYGGNGTSNFALPNLEGRTVEGTGSGLIAGQTGGSDTITLTSTNIPACFASGTRLTGASGPIVVEALRIGDLVLTVSGRLAPVRWLGHRAVALARHPRPFDVMPVRVTAGAFGDGAPARDLVLSPDHAVFVEGRLVPVRHLINGASIVQERRARVTYWHVELDRHDVILAEGMPCESYLDTGNRAAFANSGPAMDLHPDFARRLWRQRGCAPIVTNAADPALRRLHTRLLARAASGRGPLGGPMMRHA
jgi:microcystin-dependent protein